MEDAHSDRTPASSWTEFVLPALDGRPLGASLFEPEGEPLGTLILHGATATPQRFYRPFATFLADAGVRVVTYDYRGVGRSRPSSLRGDRATMTEWAELDARAVHRHVRERFAGPVALLGHSFGGQLVGLIDEARDVAGALFVGCQFAYYKDWPLLQQPRLALLWRVVVPSLTRALGYLPGQVGLGHDLPAGVAREWARWCLHPDYLVSRHPDAAARLARFDRPTAFYSFTDDDIAPPRAVQSLLARLPAATLEHRRVDPASFANGANGPIGHFGFFRAKWRQPLWSEALAFVAEVLQGRKPPRASWPGFDWDLRDEDLLADLRRCRD